MLKIYIFFVYVFCTLLCKNALKLSTQVIFSPAATLVAFISSFAKAKPFPTIHPSKSVLCWLHGYQTARVR